MANTSLTTTAIESELATYEPQLAMALPDHIPLARFKRTVLTALALAPELMQADRRSLFIACVRAAQDGLYPDGREAALVVFSAKNQRTGSYEKIVTYMPMIQGIIKRMRNSGEVASISSHVVYEHDHFDYELGDDPRISHKPALGERGKPIGVYAIAKLNNGEVLREVMSYEDVELVRSASRAKDSGPWKTYWAEMSRKSCMRRLSKRLPSSADVDKIIEHEEEQYGLGDTTRHIPLSRPRREEYLPVHAIEEALSAGNGYDTETGEVHEAHGPDDAGSLSLDDIAAIRAEEGTAALEAWWKSLSRDEQRRFGKAKLDGFKLRAAAADERGGPSGDDDVATPRSSLWEDDSYEVIPPNGDWVRWADQMTYLIAEADNMPELAKLREDNIKHFGAAGGVVNDIETAFGQRANALKQGSLGV